MSRTIGMIQSFRSLCAFLLTVLVATAAANAQTTPTPGTGTFYRVMSNDEITVNARYIITNNACTIAMGKYDKGNNYGWISITPQNEERDIVTLTDEAGTAVFNLGLSNNGKAYALWENNRQTFLAITSSNDKNPYLKTSNTWTDNANISIDIRENGDADIRFTRGGSYVYNLLRYNSSSYYFTCYKEDDNATYHLPVGLFREMYVREVTPGSYGTLCLPYDGIVSGATLYTVEGKQTDGGRVTSISLKESDKLLRGKPYIFLATDNVLKVVYTNRTEFLQKEPKAENGLVGSYEATAVDEGMYVISQNKVKRCGKDSKIGTNRCYINMDEVPVMPASANAIIFNFNESTDAIESIEASPGGRTLIYDLSGRCVKTAKKGLYIVNGKKISKRN